MKERREGRHIIVTQWDPKKRFCGELRHKDEFLTYVIWWLPIKATCCLSFYDELNIRYPHGWGFARLACSRLPGWPTAAATPAVRRIPLMLVPRPTPQIAGGRPWKSTLCIRLAWCFHPSLFIHHRKHQCRWPKQKQGLQMLRLKGRVQRDFNSVFRLIWIGLILSMNRFWFLNFLWLHWF
jgi:hypothetical protein